MSIRPSGIAKPSPLCRWFESIGTDEHSLVGGKANSLAMLTAAGFRVPRGFVMTTQALGRFLDGTEIGREAATLDQRLRESTIPEESTLAEFRERVVAWELSAELRDSLRTAYTALGDDVAVAVRSSGTREDMAGASFAGQYETFLNVRGVEALELAVKQCWASLWQPRVLEYASQRGGGASGLQMAVIVQELVAADVAGVLFTVNPLTGRESEVLIEAVFGLGESLVSGRVDADRYVADIRRGEVLSQEISRKALRVVPTDGGTEELALPAAEAGVATLSNDQVRELAAVAAAIQEQYGRPMDVEWVYSGGTLSVVQARPITHLSFAPDLGEWTTADFRDGGVSSDVCSPFMASLYEAAFDNSMPQYFKMLKLIPQDFDSSWCRMFFARPYWSMGNVKRALEKIPGYDEDGFESDLGIEPDPTRPGKRTPMTFRGVVGALPTLLALKRSFKRRIADNELFVREFDARKRPYDLPAADLRAMDRETFAQAFDTLINEFYLHTETSYFTTIYNTSNAKLELKPVFDKAQAACDGGLDELTLVSGLTDLSHIRPLKDMHRILLGLRSQGRSVDDDTVAEFVDRWRHHSRRELDIRIPRWKDDLPFVRTMLERALENFDPDADPETLERTQRAAYEAERSKATRALRRRPLLRRSFLAKLDLVRRYAWWREEMRDYSSYVYFLVRAWSMEAAHRMTAIGLLQEEDDIWYLTYQDAVALLNGALSREEAEERVRLGRWTVRSFRNFDNPNEIGTRYDYAESTESVADGRLLRGIGCSAGRVTARARVMMSIDEAESLQRGEILVTPFTDPGWTSLFARIAGVVTETGGVLSHAAVISREYGIPAVLAVKGATRAIRDGSTLTIDGNAGVVELQD